MKRARLIIAGVLAGLCVAARGENVFRCVQERVASMDPLRAASVPEAQADGLVYEMPLEVDYLKRPYTLKPSLCELPEVSADGLTYTFRLRGGSRFCDDPCFPNGKGRPVVAADLVYSLTRLADKANASSGMWLMANVESVRAADERTVVIRLKKRLHVFPWFATMPYMAAVAREAVECYGARFGSAAVGSGAYRLAKWRRNHAMRFERNPNWPGWGSDTNGVFDAVEYLVVDDPSTRWLMFLSGEVDAMGGISRDNWDAVIGKDGDLLPELKDKGMRLYTSSSLSLFYLGCNLKDPVLGTNRALRQALNCALDFGAWNRFFNNRFLPVTCPLPPEVEDRLTEPFAYAYNEARAKELLKEAGYPGGIDPKTGRRLVLTLSVGRATQDAREQAELFQAFLGRVGIRLEADFMTWDAYLKAISEGRVQLFFMGWIGDYPDPENFLQLFYSKNVSPGPNHCHYVNPAFDACYEAAMATEDKALRREKWLAAQRLINTDCPWIYLHSPKTYSLMRDRIRGYKPTDFPYGVERNFRCAE